ncbi:MAG: exo-beta-N-acetylmuramidase NamZ domain-containing protein [Thermomicrobium sp.]
MEAQLVRTGLEVFLEKGCPAIDGRRVGLITNPTGIDRLLRRTVDVLFQSNRVNLIALFGPEHGLYGEGQAGETLHDTHDNRTGLPVFSLYGPRQGPPQWILRELEVLIFDLQDIGVRYGTYLSTLALAQQAAAEAGCLFVVFDRPNPLNGCTVEGNLLQPAFRSFVGCYPLPIRHGLTAGEFARLLAAANGWPEPLVITMKGWRRDLWFDQTGLPWVQPSPNLPTLDSLTLYPGTCLVEATNCSEGRGTTRPFEIVGAPWLDPWELAADLEARGLSGVRFRPVYFTPTFSKHASLRCGGVQIHILDRQVVRAVELGLHLLDALRRQNPEAFRWRVNTNGDFVLDLLLGSDEPRRALDSGADPAEISRSWGRQAQAFQEYSRAFLLYHGNCLAEKGTETIAR